MARSKLDIFNEAIGGVPADPVDSVDDNRKSGRECRRYYDGVVSDLLEVHDWKWTRIRSALAEVANDRPGEWAHCYAMPSGVSSAIGLIPNYGSAAGIPGYVTTPMNYWSGAYADLQMALHSDIRYVIASGKLYTDLPEAILEYADDGIEPQRWPSLFATAVVKLLEMRIYKPILGSEAASNEYVLKARAAEMAKNEAKAHDLNQGPNRRPEFMSEGARARIDGNLSIWRR